MARVGDFEPDPDWETDEPFNLGGRRVRLIESSAIDASAPLPASTSTPRRTPKQLRRFHRDIVIRAAYLQGCPATLIASAMGLAKSSVTKLVANVKRPRSRGK